MNTLATLSDYGELFGPSTLKIQRRLPGPIERAWAYVTESDLRRQWLAAGQMELRVGAPFEFIWRNDELTDPPGTRPEGFAEEHRMQSRITELEPPHKIGFTWGTDGEVTIELKPAGDQVLLILTHNRLPSDRAIKLKIGAGWHMHLDILLARARGKEPEPFWDGWVRLRDEYERRMPT